MLCLICLSYLRTSSSSSLNLLISLWSGYYIALFALLIDFQINCFGFPRWRTFKYQLTTVVLRKLFRGEQKQIGKYHKEEEITLVYKKIKSFRCFNSVRWINTFWGCWFQIRSQIFSITSSFQTKCNSNFQNYW